MTDPSPRPAPAPLRAFRFPSEVLKVLETLRAAGFTAYLVGGSVRDLLLGLPEKDFDVATSARAERVALLFRRVVKTGIKHGTVTVLMGKLSIEVTTFRGEGAYTDGRRPDEVFFLDNIVEDLARRDFTINAMAFDPTRGEFVDPFGGEADLARRLVRCVRDPRERFAEDGLRPLRAVRFASVLGFAIDPPTLDAIPATLGTFELIARERIRDELVKLLLGPDPARGIDLLRSTSLLARILPAVDALSAAEFFPRTLARLRAAPADLELRLGALLHDVGAAAAAPERERDSLVERELERLRLPRRTAERVAALVRERAFGFAQLPDDASARRAIARVGRDAVDPLLALARAEADALDSAELLARVSHIECQFQQVLAHRPPLATSDLALDGKRVMALLGCAPGPEVGNALRFLLSAVLEDPGLNTSESLEALLRRRYARMG